MKDLITVVITTYNNPLGLCMALKSVLRQSYENIEVLVIDGGYRNSKYVIDSFLDKRINYIKVGDKLIYADTDSLLYNTLQSVLRQSYEEKICGNVQYCRNLGLNLAQGKYISMLDDDDTWCKDKLEKQYKLMIIGYASLITCQTIKYSGNFIHIDKPPSFPQYKDLLQSFCYSQTSCYFMNRKDLIKAGGFNEDLRSMHEYDIALRMAKKGMRIMTVDKPLVKSYCNNVTSRRYYFTKIAELLDLWRVYGKDMDKLLTDKQMFTNMIKTGVLLSLYVMGYVVKDKIWSVIFKLKEIHQNAKM